MDENNNGFILINNDDLDNKEEVNVFKDDVDSDVVIEEEIKSNKREERPRYRVAKSKKKKTFRGSALSYIAIALVCSLLGGFVATSLSSRLFGNELATGSQYNAQAITINTNDDVSTPTAVAKKAMDSVVGITTVETQQVWPFESQDVSGVGSGVIIQSDGYILTNSHVVADGKAKELKVLFENGEQVDGTVLWNDTTLDLAIVKVNVTNLPVAELGDSEKLEVGELAIAIGNPLGLEFQRTVTAGIISGLNRSVTVDGRVVIDNLIQTDASINPGNSGGPLLNAKGQVIGINTAKITSGEGLGFSIPINQVKEIAAQVINNGTYKTVFMGISGVSVVEYETRLGVDISADKGVIIIELQANSPAANAGIQVGDVITKIGDIEVEDMSQLKKTLYKYSQNDKEKISIIRNTEAMDIEIEFSVVK